MKKLAEYTDKEKIKKFNEIHKRSLEYFNEESQVEDSDNMHYYWEEIIGVVLELSNTDWNLHNSGKTIPAPAPRKVGKK